MLLIGWTTLETEAQADALARALVAADLAVCVQVDPPVTSYYVWKGREEKCKEYRLLAKFLPEQNEAISDWITQHHPYETPLWVVIKAESVAEKYLSWARSGSNR